MMPDRVSNPGPLTYESGSLPIALRGPILYEQNGTVFGVQSQSAVNPPQRALSFPSAIILCNEVFFKATSELGSALCKNKNQVPVSLNILSLRFS